MLQVLTSDLEKLGITQAMLLDKFYEQLQREFDLCEVQLYFSYEKNSQIDVLQFSLAQSLEILASKENYKYNQLLYRIDISETQLNKAFKDNQHENPFFIISELMIKRVLQKVILKLTYSKKS